MVRLRSHTGVWLVALYLLLASCSARAASADDVQILHDAELAGDGPSLVAFFQARARMDVDGDRIRQLLARFATADKQQRAAATAELLGFGALALQALRQTANDLDHPDVAERASRCLPWLEGPDSHKLLIAAAHMLAERKPEGAADALLAYLPFADKPEVVAAVQAALVAVAAPAGKPDPALLRGLDDRMGIRRAAAGAALCRAVPPEQAPDVRKLLKDPAPAVRLRAARALAEAHDAEAIPVLIDLLGESSAAERQSIEELLKELAGEWAPVLEFPTEDDISRGVRRDAWASWWRRSDGPALLAVLAKHTLTPDKRRKLQELLIQLGSDDFTVREDASRQLLAFGRLALPQLREAVKNRDAEVARRAKMLIERLETRPGTNLPIAALRLLAVRKPAGAVEALLAYLPFAEDEAREEEVRKSLTVLARRDGKPDPALRRGLADAQPKVRIVAAEALIAGGGAEGRAAVRKLLREDEPSVRLRAALALARAGEREGVSVLIELLPLLSAEECGQAEESLLQLAGESAPQISEGATIDKKKSRDAWVAWWKVNAKRVDLTRMSEHPLLGYTLICANAVNRVYEIDRHGKQRWAIDDLGNPLDAVMLPGNRVLIAEYNAGRVTERDFKGKILWQKEVARPVNVQRLPNGHTFIASRSGPIVEVDRSGKEIYSISGVPRGVLAAYRSRRGDIVCLTQDGRCLLLDTTGKLLKEIASGHKSMLSGTAGNLDMLSNGHLLIARTGDGNQVSELDRDGRVVQEWKVENAVTASPLPNGHLLTVAKNGQEVYELDRAGKIIWQHKGAHIFRARRR